MCLLKKYILKVFHILFHNLFIDIECLFLPPNYVSYNDMIVLRKNFTVVLSFFFIDYSELLILVYYIIYSLYNINYEYSECF